MFRLVRRAIGAPVLWMSPAGWCRSGTLRQVDLWICGFIVDWKPILTYATFGCKTSAGCFSPGSTLQLMATSGINPNVYHQESNWGSVDL